MFSKQVCMWLGLVLILLECDVRSEQLQVGVGRRVRSEERRVGKECA